MKSLTGSLAIVLFAAGCTQQPAAPAPPAGPAPQAHSNLAQLMRGIPFTFANIVFDAQSQDPAKPRVGGDTSQGATATFQSVYGGWQQVENSALALKETANLLIVPGRMCENGKPVPTGDETYQKAVAGLIAAGDAAYKAAQSKSMDAMVDVSDTVATACAACHEPYRDFDDQSMRCGSVSTAPASE